MSPGTWIFWDTGYSDLMETPFQWAALVLSSVISATRADLITLDAGSKSIAPDTPEPHFRALGLPDEIAFVRRNEEHQLLQTAQGHAAPPCGRSVLFGAAPCVYNREFVGRGVRDR